MREDKGDLFFRNAWPRLFGAQCDFVGPQVQFEFPKKEDPGIGNLRIVGEGWERNNWSITTADDYTVDCFSDFLWVAGRASAKKTSKRGRALRLAV